MSARSPLCTEYTCQVLGSCGTKLGCRILLVEEGGLEHPLAHDTVAALHLPSLQSVVGILKSLFHDIIRKYKHRGSERLRVHIEAHTLKEGVAIYEHRVIHRVSLFVDTDSLAVLAVKLAGSRLKHHLLEQRIIVTQLVDIVI